MRKLSIIVAFFLASCGSQKNLVGVGAQINPYNFNIQKKVVSSNGAVASAHPLASKVGVEIMKLGGNAFDAAIATQLALAVVYPNAGNIGGGGFMVARTASGQTLALDYRESAPSAAHRDMYLDANGNVMEGKSINGHLASGVPGTIAGLAETFKYAKLSWKQLVQPAIDLAEKGFVLTPGEATSFNGIQNDLKKYNTSDNAFTKSTWRVGDTLVQTELARTLMRIRDNGAAGFYQGKTAELIAAEMSKGGGIITLDDLKNYTAKWRTPHSFDYRGYTIIGMPMPSSGGILLHQMLKMIEPWPIKTFGFLSPESVNLMVEAERRAFADRAEYMGDADFYNVPVDKITSSEYLQMRMSDFQVGVAGNSEQVKPGKIAKKESEETTHLSVIDKLGNAVAVTTTLNNSYGSKTVVTGGGFFMNDEMDDFSVKPGVPNLYGAVVGEANAIAPGKRMLSSMSPTIVLQNGKPFLVVGTPGGTTIPTSVFQTIVDIIDFNMSTEDAVYKPKFHHQWLPDGVMIEAKFPAEVRSALEKMGYKFVVRNGIGRTEVIKVLPDGRFEAVADIRGDDAAEGW